MPDNPNPGGPKKKRKKPYAGNFASPPPYRPSPAPATPVFRPMSYGSSSSGSRMGGMQIMPQMRQQMVMTPRIKRVAQPEGALRAELEAFMEDEK